MAISNLSRYSETQTPRRSPRCSLLGVAKAALCGIGLLASGFYFSQNTPQHKNPEHFYGSVKALEVARNLGAPHPEGFRVYQSQSGGAMMRGRTNIEISKEFGDALNGKPSPYTLEEVEGVLAHEIGHGVLGHSENDHPAYVEMNQETDPEKSWDMYFPISRKIEKEADLFTVRVLRYAKGLIKRIARDFSWNTKPEKYDLHPPDVERIAYLKKAICEMHSEECS